MTAQTKFTGDNAVIQNNNVYIPGKCPGEIDLKFGIVCAEQVLSIKHLKKEFFYESFNTCGCSNDYRYG